MDCPICETRNIPESKKFCPTCGYDISPYPAAIGGVPQPFIEKEKQRIAWAKRLWADSRAKVHRAEAASTQSQDQFNKIVGQVERLTQVQTQLSNQLAEASSANMSARFSEMERQLELRLEAIAASRFADLSATLEQKITEILREFKDSVSEEMSTSVSETEQPLDSPIAVDPEPESPTPPLSASDMGISLHVFSFATVKVSDRGKKINHKHLQVEYFTENLGNGVTLDMVFIPGGTFMMGSPETEKGRSNNEWPQHRVRVPSFFMAKYLVTQQQWEAVMGSNPSHFKGANRPVESVSWHDATKFCQKLSQKTGHHYHLPSEAEWEYACRAGTRTPFYYGETITTDLVNYRGDCIYSNEPKGIYRKETTDVGIFPPNAFGLYDMHGNVWEWCADYWHENYNSTPTDGSAWISGGNADCRVLRGGSWYYDPVFCRCSLRSKHNAFSSYDFHGFRVSALLSGT